jgi:pilus assembly protein Flp/PilA
MTTRSKASTGTASLRKLARDQRGATLMEYLMLAGLVAIAAFAGFKLFGTNVQTAINGQAETVATIPTAGN